MSTQGISRRSFVAGLSAAALVQWPRASSAHIAPPSPDPLHDIRIRIVDTAFDLTRRAAAMRQAGVRTVIRYYAHGTGQWSGKVLSHSELDALEANDFSVATVFQNNNNVPDNFLDFTKKIEDLEWARRHANSFRQPSGSAIYFGADFDLRHWDGKKGKSDPAQTEQRIAAVKKYFEYAREELAKDGLKLGVYGCGRTCEILEGIADYFWLSASADFWRSGEYYNSRKWHLYQNRVDLPRTYGDTKPCMIDTNLANPQQADFGQWRRDGKRDPAAQAATQKVFDTRSFVAVQQLCMTNDHPERSKAPLNVDALSLSEQRARRYAISVKILREDDEYCGVSLDEGDTIVGYCRKSDLSADKSMPLRANRKLAPASVCAEPDPPQTASIKPAQRKFATAAAKSRPVPAPAPQPAAAPAAAPAASTAPAAPKVGALTPQSHGIN